VAEADAIRALCELRRPDVVIVDAGCRLGEVALLMRSLLRSFPELSVIVTYGSAAEGDVAAAVAAGIAALVPESHGLAAVLALLGRRRGADTRPGRGGMTDRELEIVVLTGSGHSVPEIAELLGISSLRVENLKRSVYAKLDVSSGAQAVSRLSSLGMLDRRAQAPAQPRLTAEGFEILTVVSGRDAAATGHLTALLVASGLPHVLVKEPGPLADQHWARWHRGPIVAALVDPEAPDWDMVAELGVPAILVHTTPMGAPELAEALARGATAQLPADRLDAHFGAVLRMVGQGYLVVDSVPMRPVIGAVRARWDKDAPGGLGLPELTARESDVLAAVARGLSIRQAARQLGIAPKTVENVQTRLFRKLGVRNRSGALAVADAFGLVPEAASPEAAGDGHGGGPAVRPAGGPGSGVPARPAESQGSEPAPRPAGSRGSGPVMRPESRGSGSASRPADGRDSGLAARPGDKQGSGPSARVAAGPGGQPPARLGAGRLPEPLRSSRPLLASKERA
jgi:two-component system, NarL family, nitrate/nitrite response regulator NarL